MHPHMPSGVPQFSQAGQVVVVGTVVVEVEVVEVEVVVVEVVAQGSGQGTGHSVQYEHVSAQSASRVA